MTPPRARRRSTTARPSAVAECTVSTQTPAASTSGLGLTSTGCRSTARRSSSPGSWAHRDRLARTVVGALPGG
ncbi:hypothetical protein [Mycolicibacterium vulneris]|uniref:hypothetical protein n=1 Tax=Mycolicibacterium vulneris TaxID=547163 RepID=UPI0015E8D268|nr:hypothetical protein [Mycolicibacterium vulneris]